MKTKRLVLFIGIGLATLLVIIAVLAFMYNSPSSSDEHAVFLDNRRPEEPFALTDEQRVRVYTQHFSTSIRDKILLSDMIASCEVDVHVLETGQHAVDIILVLSEGNALSNDLMQKIVQTVKNSIPDIEEENISISH